MAHIGWLGSPSGKEPVLGLAPTPVDTQQLQQLGREHDLAREVSLAGADVDDHALAVDVGDFQIQGFLAAQSGAVESGQQSPMLQVHRAVEQGANFFPAPDHGQLAVHLRLGDLVVEPGLLERPCVEELQGRHANLQGLPGQLLLVQQIELIPAYLLGSQLVRRLDGSSGRSRRPSRYRRGWFVGSSCAAGVLPACVGVVQS